MSEYFGRHVTITFFGGNDESLKEAMHELFNLADDSCPEGVDWVGASGPIDEEGNPV